MIQVNYDNFKKILDENLSIEKIKDKDINLKKAVGQIKSGANIYIWPSGRMGQTVYTELKANGYKKIFLVDKNKHLPEVISPDELVFEKHDVLIIATLRYCRAIYSLAEQKKCKNILMYYNIKELSEVSPIIFPEDFHDILFEELTKHLLNNVKAYENMYFSLADEISKKVFLNNMFFRLTHDIQYTFEFDSGPQYFDDAIIDKDFDGIIIDGGGYNGDTLEQFLQLNVDFKHYYLFEPDEDLLKEAKKITGDKRIHYINKGLFSTKKTLNFNKTSEDGGCITENGNTKIEVISIDEFIKEKVSFIKMDIEGCELEALKGAKNVINRYAPDLAICVYHKAADYLEIFNYIKSLNKNYKFFLRHYADYYPETVLYAVVEKNNEELKL